MNIFLGGHRGDPFLRSQKIETKSFFSYLKQIFFLLVLILFVACEPFVGEDSFNQNVNAQAEYDPDSGWTYEQVTNRSAGSKSQLKNQLSLYPRVKFSYQLDGSIRTFSRVKVYFVDLFDTSSSKINSLRRKGNTVICYFSAGSYENWRSDLDRVPDRAIGKKLDGWAGEKWLDIRHKEVRNLARSRMNLAVRKGCQGVDPDNLDAYGNNSGFSISKSDSKSFIQSLVDSARIRRLKIGLKNAAELASHFASRMDWVVAEECHQYNECSSYKKFAQKKKPIFQVEYRSKSDRLCDRARSAKASLIFANYDLNGKISFCD